jgi:hypothetical protein
MHERCDIIAEQEGVIIAQESVINDLEEKVAALIVCLDRIPWKGD